MARPRITVQSHPSVALLIARGMALITLLNLGLVIFDASYLSLRDFYLARLPWITRGYDRVKAIEPNRDTDRYLKTVADLERVLQQQGATAPDAMAKGRSETIALLTSLREQSTLIVSDNPFQLANKSGTLEKIKNRMRRHVRQDSSRQAFNQFWSPERFQSQGPQELTWFKTTIRPLIATNYYRPIGENGEFLDRFWLIDLGFAGIFLLDILARLLMIRHRRPSISWTDALLWRWYDLLLLLPFWRLLRILPALLRCHQVGWVNLERIQNQVNHYLAENLVEEISELVLVRTLNVAQSSIRQGVLKRLLQQASAELVTINDVNELEVITERLLQVVVTRVLPKVQPDLEAILRHAINQGLTQLPLYREFSLFPGANTVPQQLTQQLVHQFTEVTYTTLQQTLQDEAGQALSRTLAAQFLDSLRLELQDPVLLTELQRLLSDLLEELKLTLVDSLADQDVEQAAVEVARLRGDAPHPQRPTVQVIPPAQG